MKQSDPLDKRSLLRISGTILFWAYFLLLGGTLNGGMDPRLKMVNGMLFSALFGGWILWRWRTKTSSLFAPMAFSLQAMIAVSIIAVGLSVYPRLSAESVLWWWIAAIWYLFLLDVRKHGVAQRDLLKGVLVAGAVLMGFGYLQVLTWWLRWYRLTGSCIPGSTIRVSSLIGPANYFADVLLLLFPLTLTFWYRAVGIRRFFMGFLSIAVVYLLVFTSSRGGWMGWGAELATWIGIASWQQRKKGGLLDNRLWKRKHWWSVLFWGGIVFTSVRLALWESMDPTHPSSWNQPLASRDYIWQVAGQMWATHPWFGMGPGTYGLAFVDNASVPPDILLTHAHNLYLNVLAETGSIGLLAFFWLLIQTGRQAWKQVQAYPRNEVIAMGIVPALCGVAVHGMVEVSLGIPAILLLVVTYVALLFAESPSVPTRKPQWSTWFTGCVLVVSLAGMWINTLEFRQHAAAVLAGMEGHWNTAAFKLRQLGEMDPWNAVYWRQSGYAFGRHALDPWGRLQDQTSAQRALQDYERALRLDPHYAVPWANRAVLLWASGQPVEAVRSLEVAVEKAPRQAVFWATLGAWEEMLGQRSQALVAYRQAITLEPDWRETAFFQATTLRQEAVNTVTSPEGALDLGWKALQEGNISLATQVFMESADVNQAEAWLGLGMVALRQQDWAAAQRYVAMASLMDVWGRLKIRLTGAKGDAFFQQGDCTRAAGYYEKVWWMMRRGDSFQYGREGSQWYDWFIYRRWTFDEDLLPGFAPVFFEEDIERLHRLRECYSQEGQVERLVMLQDWLRQLEEMQEIWAK